MDVTTNSLNWFEIPVSDLKRAKHFYEEIFSIQMEEVDLGNLKMAYFPAVMNNGKVSGALAKSAKHIPSENGIIIYLNANPDLAKVLGKIESSGGKVILPKTQISEEIGYMAFFQDPEGNKLALHSIK